MIGLVIFGFILVAAYSAQSVLFRMSLGMAHAGATGTVLGG
jgi:hypothetical protein